MTDNLNKTIWNIIFENYAELIKTYGNKFNTIYELHVFELCSEYGIELNYSTIDKITLWDDGSIDIYYNENENDYANILSFEIEDLTFFYNSILDKLDIQGK